MMLKHPVLNMHKGEINGKAQVYSDKQIPMDIDTIVSFVIQSGQMSEGWAASRHVNWNTNYEQPLNLQSFENIWFGN